MHDEAISPKHDDAAGEAWLHGIFTSCCIAGRWSKSFTSLSRQDRRRVRAQIGGRHAAWPGSGARTVKTGQGAARTTCCVVEPKSM